jgi:two-component system NtrC family sensor kinase
MHRAADCASKEGLRSTAFRKSIDLKLVPKLTLALSAGVFAVVAGFTFWQVRREIDTFDQDARRVQRIVGVTAGAAVARTRTREDAIRLARRVDQSRETIRVHYVSLAADPPAGMRPLLPPRPGDLIPPGSSRQLVKPRVPGTEAADLLVTYVAAPVVDEPFGAIELSQPLASPGEYAWRGVLSALASSLAMLALGGLTMAFIGARVVGKPVSELISAARRIGEGEFDVLYSIQRRDEFGELARALRAMSIELSAERDRTKMEVQARIRALEQLRHAERLTTLGQLASVLAHEIGTPLNVIAGHAKLVSTGKLDASGARESALAIGVQCERITSIVRRVLDYARRRPPKRAHIDGSDVVGQTRALLRSLAEQRGVELEVEKSATPSDLFADPDQLQQVLINIVMNAVHASPPGRRVRIAVEHSEQVVAGKTKEFIVFAVRDLGHGIDERVKERIFEPFFTTKPPGDGTGLGLSVARDIVDEHGGFIHVSSVPGQETVFMIYLPRRADDAGPNSSS